MAAPAAPCDGGPLAKRARKTPVFVDTEKVSAFEDQHIVSVDGPWKVLLDHLKLESIALIRAPPKSGKSLLGKLAAAGRVAALKDKYEVRYVSALVDVKAEKFGYKDVEDMAKDSGASWEDSGRKSIIYYFDEVDEIPETVNRYFVSDKCGYAVFASTGAARHPGTYETPKGLLKHTFIYRFPSDLAGVREWLAGRIGVLFSEAGGAVDERGVQLMTELLMNLSGGHVGILQHVGKYCEEHAAEKNFQGVRECLATMVGDQEPIALARCFGVSNGPPDADQSVLISSLRCCGTTTTVNANGDEQVAFSYENQSHRRGLSNAYYAIQDGTDVMDAISKVARESLRCGFVHSLQPEMYKWKQTHPDWARASHTSRWAVDFARSSAGEPAATPENVVDLVASWLAHVTTEDLMSAQDHVDPAESVFQTSFHKFVARELQLTSKREAPAHWADGTFSGHLDHLVQSEMGVEFLIRKTAQNRFNAKDLLTGQTKESLVDHAARADEKAAKGHGEASYADIAARCSRGYVTVLPATVTTTTADEEYGHFQELIAKLQKKKADAPILEHNIMVAVATFGWAKWDVFLWDPAPKKCVRFEIKRQRLMYKVVDGKAVIARHFYPRPTEVWARELVVEGGALKLTGKAFEVKPEKDSVASLAEGIAARLREAGRQCGGWQLTIHAQSRTGAWKELEEDQVLYANTKERPYGFCVPQ